jgi:cytochrome b involved in lipid metabolism
MAPLPRPQRDAGRDRCTRSVRSHAALSRRALLPGSTKADVAKHKDREDVWMVIADKVFDVTKYLEDHPGGEEVLLDKGGGDATEDFEDVGHSNEARKQLLKYEVGALPPSERGAAKKEASSGGGGGAAMAVFVVIIALAVGAFFYLQQ